MVFSIVSSFLIFSLASLLCQLLFFLWKLNVIPVVSVHKPSLPFYSLQNHHYILNLYMYVNLICLPVHLSSSLHNRLGCHCLLQYQNLASLKLNSLVPTTMPCTNPSFFIFVNNIMIQSLAQAQIWEIIFYCTF